MKKQIAFYIGWDIVFIGQMYINSKLSILIRSIAQRSFETYRLLWFQIGWMIVLGVLLGILACIGNKYQVNKKSAIIELVMIGIPAAYMAAVLALAVSFATLLGQDISFHIPFWMSSSTTPMMAGSILLGYEVFIFTSRMVKKPNGEMGQVQNSSDDTL
jgi:ABC-type dipeptide/oligopeptide/nickel transport system permease component